MLNSYFQIIILRCIVAPSSDKHNRQSVVLHDTPHGERHSSQNFRQPCGQVVSFSSESSGNPSKHYRSTTGELMLRRRLRHTWLDLVVPSIRKNILQQQGKSRDQHNTRAVSRRFYVGDSVWRLNTQDTPKWLPGIIEDRLGPVKFIIGM